jgi:hypothetical protein
MVLRELDTISDLVEYLRKKEGLLTKPGRIVMGTGEEQVKVGPGKAGLRPGLITLAFRFFGWGALRWRSDLTACSRGDLQTQIGDS